MKQLFDIEKSLKLCPPKYSKGIKHIKRIVLNRSEVTYSDKNQIRVLKVDPNKVAELRDSFFVKGYVHSEPPPTVKVDPDNKNRFIGLSGWHRNSAASLAGWDTMIFDVLEFDSPLTQRKHANYTNKDRLPFVPVTINDLVKQVKEAVKLKELPNDDVEIMNFINDIADDRPVNVRQNILNKFRKHVSYSATLVCYRAQGGGEGSTKEFAERFGLPWSGIKFKNQTGRIGYITSESTPKTALVETHNYYKEFGQKIEYYAFIENPIQGGLIGQRETWLAKFNQFILDDCLFIQYILKQMGYSISLEVIKENHPVLFVGFLPQDITPNEFDNGKPLEQGVVDVNGRTVDIDSIISEKVKITNKPKVDLSKFFGINENMPQKLLDELST
jgi:hypothetical protein